MSRELHYGLSLEHGNLSVALSKVLNDSIQGSSIRHMTSRFSKSSELNSNLPETRIVQRYQSRIQNPMGHGSLSKVYQVVRFEQRTGFFKKSRTDSNKK